MKLAIKLASSEFKERYDDNISNSRYVKTLYGNVLGRDADTNRFKYWFGQQNNEAETPYEVLLGLSESNKNEGLFLK